MNIMPYSLFKKLGDGEGELMKTNMTLSGFFGEASEAMGIVSRELIVGSKTIPTTFFVVEVKGKYNVLLGVIGYTQIVVFRPCYNNVLSSGSAMKLK
jgi:hypothetical protein